MALWLAVQELTVENKELREQLAALKAEQLERQQELIRQLEERLARLEGKQ
jgi:predicted nuclease with TOPRIM domain